MASTKTKPTTSDIGPDTQRFLSYREVHERLFLSRTQTFRLEREGARLLPDVLVTPGTSGWREDRVLQYGIDTGRLAEDGQPAGGWDGGKPLNRVPDGSIPAMRRLVEEKYSAPPKVYLGAAHCSYVYGLGELAVFFLRKRQSFIPASVQVGEKFLGWDELEVIKFGRQTGRLADPAVLKGWAMRRTEEFNMDPNTPWVVDLLGEENLPVHDPDYAAREEAEGDTPS